MQELVQQSAMSAKKERRHFWQKKETVVNLPAMQPAQPINFYERAIEWTHRADKVVNLILGYLLAIASVLGFMDVLSNGEVLSSVPYLFYVWLAIMGLGVDFQILLVVGRIPDVFGMPAQSWQKWTIFLFNVVFLLFLVVMSIMTGAIFTQHRDMANSTISSSMNMLGIDSIIYVYGRAALATLLLVLMAVDRTMERWRMQIAPAGQQLLHVQQAEPVQTGALQTSDLEKVLQAVQAMNQQNLQTMQNVTIQMVGETVERFAATISLPGGTQVKQLEPGGLHVQAEDDDMTTTEEREAMGQPEHAMKGKQNYAFEKDYKAEINALLTQEPELSDRDIAARVGCSVRTAYKWRTRIQQPLQG